MTNDNTDPSTQMMPMVSGGSSATTRASSERVSSPSHPDINQILSCLQDNTDSNDEQTHPPKRQRNIVLTPDQFNQLLQTYATQPSPISFQSPTSIAASTTSLASLMPAYYSNAKYEEISFKAIKPAYDGSEEGLIPFLTKLDLRLQHEDWAPATYVTIANKRHGLTVHFTSLTEADMCIATESRWDSSTIDTDKHTVGHATYSARLLGMVIINSVTDTFMTTLIHRIPTKLCNDGTNLLWAVCHNIHRNNVAFHEHIGEKIRVATLADNRNDVTTYIISIKNYLKMITPISGSTTDDNGLLTNILHQLKVCPVPLFRDYIRKLHVGFQKGEFPDFTPIKLLTQVEDKIRALKHASEWSQDNSSSPSAMALVTSASHTPSALEYLIKQQTILITKLLEHRSKDSKGSYHDWKHKAPANLQEIRRYNGKVFKWCTKCNGRQGQWASAHDTKTHIDGFRQEKGKFPSGQRHRPNAMIATTDGGQHSATDDILTGTPPQGATTANQARIDLAAGLDAAWRFDVSDELEP
jgi:hypothetical protein